jgi:hypothetical protein
MNIYLQKNDIHCTLTTYLYCHFWMLYSAEQMGHSGYIHWPKGLFLQSYEDSDKFKQMPNAYDWYFIQPKFTAPPNRDETWTWENWKDPIPVSLMAQGLPTMKSYFKKHLHFNYETNVKGQAIVDKYDIDFKKTIGITWRGTDIYLESENGNSGRKYTPIEYYFEWIDKALEQIPDARIAVTAEEEGILDPLFKRYPQAFLIEEFYQAPKGSKHNPERFSPMSGFERGMQPALMVWLFSKCAWLIKNRASTSAVASWISDGEIVSINHTEILGFPPHIDEVEYKGKLYPLTR